MKLLFSQKRSVPGDCGSHGVCSVHVCAFEVQDNQTSRHTRKEKDRRRVKLLSQRYAKFAWRLR